MAIRHFHILDKSFSTLIGSSTITYREKVSMQSRNEIECELDWIWTQLGNTGVELHDQFNLIRRLVETVLTLYRHVHVLTESQTRLLDQLESDGVAVREYLLDVLQSQESPPLAGSWDETFTRLGMIMAMEQLVPGLEIDRENRGRFLRPGEHIMTAEELKKLDETLPKKDRSSESE